VHRSPVNGQPGILIVTGGDVTGVVSLAVAGGRIAEVRVVTNPDKLRAVQPVSSPGGSDGRDEK
jgi:RNA polymerase sigma-70 factor, ECF subfamily